MKSLGEGKESCIGSLATAGSVAMRGIVAKGGFTTGEG